jgi:hypothetical protein
MRFLGMDIKLYYIKYAKIVNPQVHTFLNRHADENARNNDEKLINFLIFFNEPSFEEM